MHISIEFASASSDQSQKTFMGKSREWTICYNPEHVMMLASFFNDIRELKLGVLGTLLHYMQECDK